MAAATSPPVQPSTTMPSASSTDADPGPATAIATHSTAIISTYS
jgi:hypothetical protein